VKLKTAPANPTRVSSEDTMNSLNAFRIVLVSLALITGSYALASSFAELSALDRPAFPSDPAKISASVAGELPEWLRVAQSGKQEPTTETTDRNDRARARVKSSLSVSPYSPDLWLALALLQAQRDPRDPTFSEALKMSYFIAPNEMKLMPVRLDAATLFDALADPDLKELARGDVRLMVTRQPELRASVTSAYRRASRRGKAFLEEAVQSIDPSFLPALRG
jgi:hypothetical protein